MPPRISTVDPSGAVKETLTFSIGSNVFDSAARLVRCARSAAIFETYILDDGEKPPFAATADEVCSYVCLFGKANARSS